MAANNDDSEKMNRRVKLSTSLVAAISLIAIFCGFLLKSSIENHTNLLEHAGIRAEFPIGWKVDTGLVGEEFVFGGGDPFDSSLSYSVYLVPVSNDMKVTDLVVNRNLQRGQRLSMYKVLDQGVIDQNGKEAYSVHFVYVKSGTKDSLPMVVEGLDNYTLTQPKSIIVTLEADTSIFKESQVRFGKFLSSVSFINGGN